MDFVFSEHAKKMKEERNIIDKWIIETMNKPDYKEEQGEIEHYIKEIEEYGQRRLRIIVNKKEEPNKIITLFFDRRLSSK